MNRVEKAIIKTLAFFDILGRPLTLEEIWRFLYRVQASQLQVLMGLQNLQKNGEIIKKNSFYVLKDRQNIISEFIKKQIISKKRWEKVKWVCKIIELTPFVKNISVINSLAAGTSNKESDIDIVLITKKNRLWTARAIMILLLEIIGQNKNKWFKAGKFCLGFAFDETRLDLGHFLIKDDVYTIYYWLANMTSVFDRGIYQNLLKKNVWVFKELPNWQAKEIIRTSGKRGLLEKMLSGKFGEYLENFLAKMQIGRIWKDPQNKRKGASVIADESMMKLHAYDRREEFQKTWQKILTKYGFSR